MPASAISATHAMPSAWSVKPVTISGRSPILSAIAPAIGAIVTNVAVHGTSRSPASSGSYPSPVCRSCAKKNTPVNSDANVMKIAALLGRERGAQEREAERHDQRRPDALQRPRADQDADAGRQR